MRLVVPRIALCIALITITWLAFTGEEVPIATVLWDKLNHVFAFMVLGFLIDSSFPSRNAWQRAKLVSYLWKSISLILYGCLLEVGQSYLPSRYFEWQDIAADCIGILIYLLLVWIYLRFTKRKEKIDARKTV